MSCRQCKNNNETLHRHPNENHRYSTAAQLAREAALDVALDFIEGVIQRALEEADKTESVPGWMRG